mgnify:CR=1 FL=1
MNTIVLMGRLARDPETKLASTQKGQTKVSRFPLVVKRNRTRADANENGSFSFGNNNGDDLMYV